MNRKFRKHELALIANDYEDTMLKGPWVMGERPSSILRSDLYTIARWLIS